MARALAGTRLLGGGAIARVPPAWGLQTPEAAAGRMWLPEPPWGKGCRPVTPDPASARIVNRCPCVVNPPRQSFLRMSQSLKKSVQGG